jgi:hypothetical protein
VRVSDGSLGDKTSLGHRCQGPRPRSKHHTIVLEIGAPKDMTAPVLVHLKSLFRFMPLWAKMILSIEPIG